MRRSAISFAACTALSACGDPAPPPPPVVPPALVQPVAASCPPFRVEGDVARCLIRQRAAIDRANAQLAEIGRIAGAR